MVENGSVLAHLAGDHVRRLHQPVAPLAGAAAPLTKVDHSSAVLNALVGKG